MRLVEHIMISSKIYDSASRQSKALFCGQSSHAAFSSDTTVGSTHALLDWNEQSVYKHSGKDPSIVVDVMVRNASLGRHSYC